MSSLILDEVEEEEEEEEDERLEDFDIYRLDYEERRISSSSDDEKNNARGGKEQQPSSPSTLQSTTGLVAAGGEVFEPGDHVYMWCTMYQHHGIVLRVNSSDREVLIAEFTNVQLANDNTIFLSASTASGAVSGGGVTGGFRFVREVDPGTKWHKVKYQASTIECMTWRPGTCSAAKPLEAIQILMRVQFLHDCRHLLPEYHLLASNCETVAVWCVTGKWETLQYQQTMKWSQVGALTSASVLPGVGMVAAGLAFWHSKSTRDKWQETADRLNKEFQWYALGRRPTLLFDQKI